MDYGKDSLEFVDYRAQPEPWMGDPEGHVPVWLTRAQAEALLGLLGAIDRGEAYGIRDGVVRGLLARIKSSVAADRQIDRSDLTLTFHLTRNMAHIAREWRDNAQISTYDHMIVNRVMTKMGETLFQAMKQAGKVPNRWRVLQVRTESLN